MVNRTIREILDPVFANTNKTKTNNMRAGQAVTSRTFYTKSQI